MWKQITLLLFLLFLTAAIGFLTLQPTTLEYIAEAREVKWVHIEPEPIEEPKPIQAPVQPKDPDQEILEIIDQAAKTYGVDRSLMRVIIAGESGFNPEAIGDAGKSCGLAQIHTEYHPDISCEQAKDPYFAADFLAKHLAEGKCSMWSVCRTLMDL